MSPLDPPGNRITTDTGIVSSSTLERFFPEPRFPKITLFYRVAPLDFVETIFPRRASYVPFLSPNQPLNANVTNHGWMIPG